MPLIQPLDLGAHCQGVRSCGVSPVKWCRMPALTMVLPAARSSSPSSRRPFVRASAAEKASPRTHCARIRPSDRAQARTLRPVASHDPCHSGSALALAWFRTEAPLARTPPLSSNVPCRCVSNDHAVAGEGRVDDDRVESWQRTPLARALQ